MTSRLGDLHGRALWVLLGCLVCQLGLGLGYVFSPLLVPITEELGLSRAVFSTGNALRLFVMSAASPLVGLAVASRGARPVLLVAACMVTPTFWFVSRMQGIGDLYAANVSLAIMMTGFGDVTVGALVSNWIVRGRGTALGIVYTGSNLAGAALVPLASWLVTRGSWREALVAIGLITTALILPCAAFVVREPRAGEGARLASDPDASPGRAGRADLTLRQALRTRSFWILLFALFGFFFYMLGVLNHFHAALTDAGLTPMQAGGYFGTAIFLGMFSKVAMGLLADRIPARPALLIDYGLFSASSIFLLLVPDAPFLQVFVVTFGFSYAARDVVYPLMIVECFGVRYLASIYGTLLVVLAPAGSLGDVFAGFCFETFGDYAPAFRVYAVTNLIVLGSLFGLRDERKRL